MARQDQQRSKQPCKRLLSRESNRSSRTLGNLAVKTKLFGLSLVLSVAVVTASFPTAFAQTSEPDRSKWDKVLGKQRKRAPKKSVRRAQGGGDGTPEGVHFSHKLNLNSMAQLPSILELSMPTDSDLRTNIAQIRALMVLDGKLLSLPLRYDSSYNSFTAQFPTPHESLNYQFQLIRKDGGTILSDSYAVNPSCEEELTRLLDSNKEKFAGQRALALEATRKLEDIHRMNYLINGVKNLVQSGSTGKGEKP